MSLNFKAFLLKFLKYFLRESFIDLLRVFLQCFLRNLSLEVSPGVLLPRIPSSLRAGVPQDVFFQKFFLF